jgi:hypothetical protein
MNKELKTGIKVEREHKRTLRWLKRFVKKNGRFPKDNEIFKSIASDHLAEHKDYYQKLLKAKL